MDCLAATAEVAIYQASNTSVLAVTMVFPEDRLMAKMFNEEMASFYEKYYEDKGVTLIKGDTVTGFEGDGKVEGTLPSACVHACCQA